MPTSHTYQNLDYYQNLHKMNKISTCFCYNKIQDNNFIQISAMKPSISPAVLKTALYILITNSKFWLFEYIVKVSAQRIKGFNWRWASCHVAPSVLLNVVFSVHETMSTAGSVFCRCDRIAKREASLVWMRITQQCFYCEAIIVI